MRNIALVAILVLSSHSCELVAPEGFYKPIEKKQMEDQELKAEMLAMWDAVLAGNFGVNSAKELSDEQTLEAVRLWRDEIQYHKDGAQMEAYTEKVLDEWPD